MAIARPAALLRLPAAPAVDLHTTNAPVSGPKYAADADRVARYYAQSPVWQTVATALGRTLQAGPGNTHMRTLAARVACLAGKLEVAYEPTDESKILELADRIRVVRPEKSPPGYAQIRVVIPYGQKVPRGESTSKPDTGRFVIRRGRLWVPWRFRFPDRRRPVHFPLPVPTRTAPVPGAVVIFGRRFMSFEPVR